MQSNAGTTNRQGGLELRSHMSPPPFSILAWLLITLSTLPTKGQDIKRTASSEASRRRKFSRLLGHVASWTGPYTAQQSAFPSATYINRYNSKPSQSSNWGAEICAKRKSLCPSFSHSSV